MTTLPPAVPWAPAAVRLLQGVVHHDDAGDTWERVLAGLTPLSDYFARIGLMLIGNEEDGFASGLNQFGQRQFGMDLREYKHAVPASVF